MEEANVLVSSLGLNGDQSPQKRKVNGTFMRRLTLDIATCPNEMQKNK